MGKDDLKKFITDAIKSDSNIRQSLDVLKKNKTGSILNRYKEEYRRKTGGKEAKDDGCIRNTFISAPGNIKNALDAWVKTDIWNHVNKKTGKTPDEYDFNLSFHEVLDEIELDED